MKLGPIYIFKCPNCNNLILRESIISGNTFGATLYSDGKTIYPMLPEFPIITKCSKCETIFWFSKLKEIRIIERDEDFSPFINRSESAKFLTRDDYILVLKNDLFETTEEEIYIRQQIWWDFNDRLRGDKPLFNSESEEELWRENINRLIEILDINDINNKLKKAELYRNLSNFQKCEEIISNIENPDLNWVIEALYSECCKKNPYVFQLK